MLIRFIGFRFEVEGKGSLNLKNFSSSLATVDSAPSDADQSRRLLFLNDSSHPEYCVGLVVTVKDHRTYCELVNSGGSLLVKVNELNQDSSLMEFNFFVFNKKTGSGLYQHYHQSCSANSFGELAQRKFHDHRIAQRQLALEAAGETATDAAKKKIAAKFGNRLKFSVLVRKEALKVLISEMRRVKAFEYALETPVVPQDAFAPLRPFVRMKSERLAFSMKTPTSFVADAIDAFVSSSSLKRGQIEAVDDEGVDRVIKIMDNPDSFGEYDFDDLVAKLNKLELTKFEQSWIIAELIKKCKENVVVFEYEVEP